MVGNWEWSFSFVLYLLDTNKPVREKVEQSMTGDGGSRGLSIRRFRFYCGADASRAALGNLPASLAASQSLAESQGSAVVSVAGGPERSPIRDAPRGGEPPVRSPASSVSRRGTTSGNWNSNMLWHILR